MFYAALDAFVETMKANPLSHSYRRRIAETVSDLKKFRPDVSLADIDRVWLENLTDSVKSRPLGVLSSGVESRVRWLQAP